MKAEMIGSFVIMPVVIYCFVESYSHCSYILSYFSLRASMEGFLDAYNPNSSVTPAGIFINRVEVRDFFVAVD